MCFEANGSCAQNAVALCSYALCARLLPTAPHLWPMCAKRVSTLPSLLRVRLAHSAPCNGRLAHAASLHCHFIAHDVMATIQRDQICLERSPS